MLNLILKALQNVKLIEKNHFKWLWMGVNGSEWVRLCSTLPGWIRQHSIALKCVSRPSNSLDCARPRSGGFGSTRLHPNALCGLQTHSILLDLGRVGPAALDCTQMCLKALELTRVWLKFRMGPECIHNANPLLFLGIFGVFCL